MGDHATDRGVNLDNQDTPFHFSEWTDIPFSNAAAFGAWANANPDTAYALINRTVSSFRETAQQVEQANNQATYLQGIVNTFQNLAPHADDNRRQHFSKKVNDPDEFDGNKSKFEAFETQLTIKLLANADHFPQEKDKVTYVFSLLRGDAAAQVQHYIDNATQTIGCPDVLTLMQDLRAAFGDPDRRATAQNAIHNLLQKNKSFAEYLAAFNRDIGFTGYNEETKKSTLRRGLSAELLRALEDKDVGAMSFRELVETCQRLDSNMKHTASLLASRSQGRQPRGPGSHFAAPLGAAAPTALPPVSVGDAMDLSAGAAVPRVQGLVNGKLTPEEKLRRRQAGLCTYCGGPGHIAANCPQLAARNARNPVRGAVGAIEPAPAAPAEQEKA
uniref:Retrotransposon-derived protein PEG10 n=1 Tax=Passalora fulva TaxID=5499 RepID=A0A9Q8P547_PASFU